MDNYERPQNFNEFGVTKYGFRRKTYSEILAEKISIAREEFGVNIDTSETSFFGQLLRNAAWEQAVMWEYLEQLYFSPFVDTAEGVGLDHVGMYLTITRRPATKAKGVIKIAGEGGTIIPKGFKVATTEGRVYETTQEAIIVGNTALVPVQSIEAGKRSNIDKGAIVEILNPLSGIDYVINEEAIEGGLDVESDAEFRQRYKESYSRVGGSTVPAITAALLDIDGVVDCEVRENVTMETVDGMPPKSIECYVFGGDDVEIIKAIYENKAAGIQSFGSTIEKVEDEKGYVHQIGFTRPETVKLWAKIRVTKDEHYLGDDALKRFIINYVGGYDNVGMEYSGLTIGKDVMLSKAVSAIMCPGGVLDAEILFSKDGENWETGNIEIARNEIARISADRIVIEYV